MSSRKCGDFVTIAAQRHGAPAAAARARIVIEEEGASRISTKPDARSFAFREEFRSGPSNSREKPIEAVFTSQEFDSPRASSFDEFVVTFRNSQDFVDRRYPFAGNALFCGEGMKARAKSVAKSHSAIEEIESGLWVGLRERQQLMVSFWRNDLGCAKETDQLFPAKRACRATGGQRGQITKIDRETATDEDKAEIGHGLTSHAYLTVSFYQNG